MSDTKIVIDKEQILDIIKSQSINQSEMLFHIKKIISSATEIQIDQSIEERAESEYPKVIQTTSIGTPYDANDVVKIAFIKGATQQQIIEQLKVKELKICVGCGRLSNEPLSEGYLSCCPDNKYIPIREYWHHSRYLNY